MTLETPFRLMWTDEEGDNVCFSTDEELAQALKFVKAQENQLFKVIIKTPQVQQEQAQAAREARARNKPQSDFGASTFARGAAEFGEGMNQMASHFCRQFGDQSNAWNTNQMNGKKAEKMAQSNNVYPDLGNAPMEEDFTDVTEDVNRARMYEAMKKMAELGFEGEWVKTLLESCNCDIAKAVEKMNPESK